MSRRLSLMIDSLQAGGAEQVLVAMAPAMVDLGWDVTVDVLVDRVDAGLAQKLEMADVPVRVHGVRRMASPSGWKSVSHRLSEGVDLIHAHLEFACVIGCTLGRFHGIPSVTTQHVFTTTMSGRAGLRTRLEHRASRAFAEATVAVSASGRDHLLDMHGYDPNRVTVIPNGIDESRFALASPASRKLTREGLQIGDDTVLLMTASVLREAKGIQHLIAALPAIVDQTPNVELVVVGDGPYASELRQIAAASPAAGRIRFLGMRHDLENLLPAADLFVHPTLGDVLPTVIMEAMAVGLPVVASRTGGVPELVRHDHTGLLVEPGDIGELTEALRSLLFDSARRARFSASGRSHVESGYTLAQQAHSLDALYRRVLAGD